MRLVAGVRVTVPDADRLYDHIRAGRGFTRGGTQTAVALQLGHIQIFNPVASGVNCIVYNAYCFGGSAQQYILSRHDTQLGTSIGAGVNLLIGGTAGACGVFSATSIALTGTEVERYVQPVNVAALPTDRWFFELGPGEGIILSGTVANDDFRAGYRWVEIPV